MSALKPPAKSLAEKTTITTVHAATSPQDAARWLVELDQAYRAHFPASVQSWYLQDVHPEDRALFLALGSLSRSSKMASEYLKQLPRFAKADWRSAPAKSDAPSLF